MQAWNRRWALGALVLGPAALSACGGNSEASSGQATLRLLNASNGYGSLDLTIDDASANSAIGYGSAGAYVAASSDGVTTALTANGSITALTSASRTLTADTAYTLVAYGWAGALKTALIEENIAAADSGKAKLMVTHLASDAGTLDVYLTGSDETLDGATATASGVAGGASVGFVSLSAGTYRLRVTGSGDKSDLRLDVSGLVLGSTQVGTLLLVPAGLQASTGAAVNGGVLVSGVLALQTGSVTALRNAQSRVRVVAAVSGNGRVTASVAGTALASAAVSPTIGNYGLVSGGTVAVLLGVNGNPVAVADQALPAGGDYTLLVWGDAAAPQLTLIGDDNRLPAVSSNAKIRLVHGVAGLPSALTLTADFSAVAASIGQGQASAYASVTGSSAMRLDVTSPLSTTPLYALADASIGAKGLYTLFMLGDAATPMPALRKER